ncbi:MAG: hypothetical protein R6V33_04770 [Pelovirga sp.]
MAQKPELYQAVTELPDEHWLWAEDGINDKTGSLMPRVIITPRYFSPAQKWQVQNRKRLCQYAKIFFKIIALQKNKILTRAREKTL